MFRSKLGYPKIKAKVPPITAPTAVPITGTAEPSAAPAAAPVAIASFEPGFHSKSVVSSPFSFFLFVIRDQTIRFNIAHSHLT